MIRSSLYRLTYQWLLNLAARRDHYGAALCHLVYGLHNHILRICPPQTTVTLEVHGIELEFPAGHLLPLYVKQHPQQEVPLFNLARTIYSCRRRGAFLMADVGANVGDTAVLTALQVPGHYLCVEGDERYFSLLRRNVSKYNLEERFVLEQCFCGESADRETTLASEVGYGTASVKRLTNGTRNVRCLDDLVCKGDCLRTLLC